MSKTKQKKVNPYAKQPEKKTNWPLIIVAAVLVTALIVAFLRPTLAGLTCGRENAREGGIPSSGRLGERVFINYVVVLTLLHHAVFFLLEALSWDHVLHTVVRIVVSSVVTVAFVWIAARIFTAQFSARV